VLKETTPWVTASCSGKGHADQPAGAERIARDGKLPNHGARAKRVESGETAVDTLLNLAGLASSTANPNSLDDRVRTLVK